MNTKEEVRKTIKELYQLDQAIRNGTQIKETNACVNAAKALETAYSIDKAQNTEQKQSDQKSGSMVVSKKKIMKPLKTIYKEYDGKVYVTGFGTSYITDMPCILQIDPQSIRNSLGDYFAYELVELRNGSCIAKIDVSCIILKTWTKKFLCKDVTKEINQMITNAKDY